MSADRPLSPDLSRSLALASEVLRRGQVHEAHGELPAALARYDEAIALLTPLHRCHVLSDNAPVGASLADARSPASADARALERQLAIAWMNRGNALRKKSDRLALSAAVAAYDRAIALLIPFASAQPADHALCNSLGAAHLNRASTLLALDTDRAGAEALASADRAVAALRTLPLESNIFYRINLAGAWLNRANALLRVDLAVARISARIALDRVADVAPDHLAAADAALSARRTLLAIIGRELADANCGRGFMPRRDASLDQSGHKAPSTAPAPNPVALLAEASDLIDDGLALARLWETRRVLAFRAGAAQLFHAGAALYAAYQPHFLAEFLDENEALARELPAVVQTMLARAHRTAHERCLVADSAEPLSRTFATLADLSAIADRLAAFAATPAPSSLPA